MTYSLSKKFLAATSALLLISMSAVPASAAADNSDAVSPLSAGNRLSEAAKQYLLRYPPAAAWTAKPPAKIPPRSLFRLAPPRKGMAGRGLGTRYRGRG